MPCCMPGGANLHFLNQGLQAAAESVHTEVMYYSYSIDGICLVAVYVPIRLFLLTLTGWAAAFML